MVGKNTAILIAALFAVSVSMAQAETLSAPAPETAKIGANFKDSGTEKLLSDEIAGVLPQSEWNNLHNPFGSQLNVLDSFGEQTTVDIQWISPSTWRNDWEIASADDRLMHGFLDSVHPDGDQAVVTVTDVLGTIGSPFDVYVYFDGNSEVDRRGGYTIGDTTYYMEDLVDWAGPDGGPFVQVTSTDPNNPGVGNYVVFRGVQGDFVLTAHGMPGDPKQGDPGAKWYQPGNGPPINGIQIVVPEPAALLLLLGALLMLPFFRRHLA